MKLIPKSVKNQHNTRDCYKYPVAARLHKITSSTMRIKYYLAIPTLLLAVQTVSASFTDVMEDHQYSEAILWAQENSVVDGYDDGTFKPDSTINRAEFVKIVASLHTKEVDTNQCTLPTDITPEDWFTNDICYGLSQGFIAGYPDNTFRPANPINFVEASKIIAEIHNQEEFESNPDEEWFMPYLRYVKAYNAIPPTVKSEDQEITRGEMMYIIHEMIIASTPIKVVEATTATMETSLGIITLELYPQSAPIAVTNFATHANNGYYDGHIFHRVIPGFMIQGGDPLGNGTGGESIWGRPFQDEFDKTLTMKYGTLAMANSGPGTNGSQFFIVQAETGTPWLQGKHTIFGKVTAGMDIVNAIANVEKNENDKPLVDVTFSVTAK
jgi:cyclophilin family peptidyl-prolyl cis-trans isomerase